MEEEIQTPETFEEKTILPLEDIAEEEIPPPPIDSPRKLKRYLYYFLAFLFILAVLFIPIKGKSLFNRLLELRKPRIVNLAPNPSFEEGTDNKPAGWTTRSETVGE